MSNGVFSFKKALSIFGLTPDELPLRLAQLGLTEDRLPPFARSASRRPSSKMLKSWTLEDLPRVGALIGYMPKPPVPLAIGIFVTKGGVLKSSLTLNLARTAALHGLKVCVVGLDMQGDITANLSREDFEYSANNSETNHGTSLNEPGLARENSSVLSEDPSDAFTAAIEKMDATLGLADFYSGECGLRELIQATDLPTLFYIPETPELVSMEQSLVHRNRREYWLKEKVVAPLKEEFDLILMDCSPNWNRLITNALVASDVLISPLECKINNFRNFRTFNALIKEFREDLSAKFEHIFVPTRLAPGRKLSQEIYKWYRDQLPNCVAGAVRESSQGEEAIALKISLPEHAPHSAAGDEMSALLKEIWQKANSRSRLESAKLTDTGGHEYGTTTREGVNGAFQRETQMSN